MMETQLLSCELIEQGVSVKAGALGNLPYPFGSAFELCETSFTLSELILPNGVGLSAGEPGRAFLFDCSKLGCLTVDSTLEAGLKDVDLLSLGLGIEPELGVVLQGKLFGAEELGLGGGIIDVSANRLGSLV
jgi:hypothetical protein